MSYRVAVAISGAVSLGAYEAGTMFELVRAIDEHNANNDNPRIEIDVLTGASAGGMTAALFAQKLLFDAEALTNETDNVGYKAWVEMADIEGLLTPLPGDNQANSLLSNGFVKNIADSLINKRYEFEPTDANRHAASAREIKLGLAMSNLNGVDYQVDTFKNGVEGLTGGFFTQTRFQDRYTTTLTTTSDNKVVWEDIAIAARGCGAFPIAFSPEPLRRKWDNDDYKGRDAVAFKPRHFSFMDGGTFNNYPLGMAVELADSIDLGPTDYERRFYFYISPNPKDSAAKPKFNGKTASFVDTTKQMINSVFLQSGFQEWLLEERVTNAVLKLDAQALKIREQLYKTTSAEAKIKQIVINSLLDVVYADAKGEYFNDVSRLTLQYGSDNYERELPADHFKLWIDTIALIEHAANLGPKNAKTIYTITAKEGELSGELLGSFLGFFDQRFRHYDYERGRLNAMRTLNSILEQDNQETIGVKHLPLNIPKRNYADIQAFLDKSSLNNASMGDVKKSSRKKALKRIKKRFYSISKEIGLGRFTRAMVWSYGLKKRIKLMLALY